MDDTYDVIVIGAREVTFPGRATTALTDRFGDLRFGLNAARRRRTHSLRLVEMQPSGQRRPVARRYFEPGDFGLGEDPDASVWPANRWPMVLRGRLARVTNGQQDPGSARSSLLWQ